MYQVKLVCGPSPIIKMWEKGFSYQLMDGVSCAQRLQLGIIDTTVFIELNNNNNKRLYLKYVI